VGSLSDSRRYLVALGIVIGALALRAIMSPLWETTAPFALFMFATVFAAWFAGMGPALLTGAAGVLTRLYFDSPRIPGTFLVTWEESVRLTLFSGFVVAVAVVLNRMREDRRQLEASVLAAQREIQERRRVEAALRDSEQRLRQLANAMPQIVWTAKAHGIEYFNEQWTEYTGLSLDQSRGENGWHQAVHPDDQSAVSEVWERARQSAQPFDVEYRLRNAKTGEWRWFLARAVPVRDAEGRVEQWFGTATDIDDQKRLELTLATARGAAEEANRLKDEFLAMVSHELRTPLNAILGWVSLLRGGSLSQARTAHALEVIQRNARAQSQIVSDLLDVARTLTGRLHLEPVRADLTAVVRSAVDSVRSSARARNVQLSLQADDSPLFVWGDVVRLEQIGWNLLSNAVKFTPTGGSVDVRLRQRDSYAELSVNDTGAGIAPDILPHIFHRFQQADSSPTRAHGGLGLGLAIVRHLVELHGGSVTAESKGSGHGSRFTVLIPLKTSTADPADTAPPAAEQSGPRVLTGFRLLVVDMDEDCRSMAAAALEVAGAVVETAATSADACRLIGSMPFSGWIVDLTLAEEDGCALLRQLRELPASDGGATPALALTANAEPRDRARAIQAGFQRFLAKPISAPALVSEVAALVRVRSATT
jgi:PAS domain S-box-containing protein